MAMQEHESIENQVENENHGRHEQQQTATGGTMTAAVPITDEMDASVAITTPASLAVVSGNNSNLEAVLHPTLPVSGAYGEQNNTRNSLSTIETNTIDLVNANEEAGDKDGIDLDDEIEDEGDDEIKENYEGFNGTGRTITLQTLMAANVLQPGKGLMTIEYLGQKFVGDLLPDGKIKSQETETVFLTPSAWAIHCKRIINPEKKSGCGWSSVKFKGKKLNAYKNSWLRKCAMHKDIVLDDLENDVDKKCESPMPAIKRTVFQHSIIANRNVMHDANMLIEAVPFTTLGKLQPFLITISSSALLLADFHCHLTMHEVCGYLAGNWDVNTHTLSITKAYPCRSSRYDRFKASDTEREIQKNMIKDQLLLVGWYHSHPKFQAEPTLRDCDAQLDYQIRMRGSSDATYTPCVALIISPYYDENPTLESVVKSIWIVPPNENKQALEYGRPMLMQYSVLPDKEIPEGVRMEIQSCVNYYSQYRNEIVRFSNIYSEDVTFIEKLKNTLYPKFPVKQNEKSLWNWICTVLGCEEENDFIPPKTIKIIDTKEDNVHSNGVRSITTVQTTGALLPPLTESKFDLKAEDDIMEITVSNKIDLTGKHLNNNTLNDDSHTIQRTVEEQAQAEQKANELKVLSLQEQLCLPSGLNMNPVRMLSPLATPHPPTSTTGTGVTTVTSVSSTTSTVPIIIPPITVPSGIQSVSLTSTTCNNVITQNVNSSNVVNIPLLVPGSGTVSASSHLGSNLVTTTIGGSGTGISGSGLVTNYSCGGSGSSGGLLPPLPPTMQSTTSTLSGTNISSLPHSASPCDSPITIPSNSASPAKFELPVRASPSPAKSDTSSHTSKTRNSPAPSPGKFSISDIARNSPSITPTNKYDSSGGIVSLGTTSAGLPSTGMVSGLPTANDLMAASLAQLAGQLPPNFLQADLAALFQQQRKDYGNTSLNQLAAAAAKVGSGGNSSGNTGSQKHLSQSMNNNQTSMLSTGGSSGGMGSGLMNTNNTATPDFTDPNVAAAVAAYSQSFNMPRLQDMMTQPQSQMAPSHISNNITSTSSSTTQQQQPKSKSERSSKSGSSSSSSGSCSSSSSTGTSNSYKTKLMKELDELKNDPLKMSELIRSPEYAAFLLQQAEALGATTLGSLGFSTDFSYLASAAGLAPPPPTVSNKGSKGNNNSASVTAAANAAAASAAALTADYNNLLQASKLLGYDTYLQQQQQQQHHHQQQQTKNNDFNAFLHQQMAAAAAAAASSVGMPPTASSGSGSNNSGSISKKHQQAAASAVAHPDYTTLLQTYSKLFDPGNQFGMMGPATKSTPSSSHPDLSALLAAGVGAMGGMGGMSGGVGPGSGSGSSNIGTSQSGSFSGSSSSKQKQQHHKDSVQQQLHQQTDMLNQLLQSEKQQSDLNALLYHQNKAAADLNALFAPPAVVPSASLSGGGGGGGVGKGSGAGSLNANANSGTPSLLTDSAAAYYNALAQEKIQDYAAFFQQQQAAGKYGIPDPLSKSTLAANNLFMSPSALLKIQQESLSAMMMKPPKSTSSRTRESSASPALERLTPTKTNVGLSGTSSMVGMGVGAGGGGVGSSTNSAGVGGGSKYNFSAVDLAISSVVPSNTPSPAPSDGSNSSSHRRTSASATPPVDLCRLYGELTPPGSLAALNAGLSGAAGTKKRMEFSSIADLAAPPPAKIPKTSDDVLNLSNE